MGVSIETWCFCKGVGKTERMKASIFSGKGPAMATICAAGDGISGTGFLIHRSLLLTTHLNIPSVSAAETAEIRLQNGLLATLVPQRFFITSSVLDLTIVGLDVVDGDSNAQGQYPHYLKTCSKPNLDLGSTVYFLGYLEKEELSVGEGKVVIATDNLVKLSIDGTTWRPGSAGFDAQGNLAFMICDPMKLSTSPNAKSSSTFSSSSISWKKDSPLQFGIPIPIICDWLNQHWEGSLDELTKPKLPIIRLISSGQRSEHSCASFTLRPVFKSAEAANDEMPSSSTMVAKGHVTGSSNSVAVASAKDDTVSTDPNGAHIQGIPTPEIYESPKLTAVPLRRIESAQVQLLDINFPPKNKAVIMPPIEQHLPKSDERCIKELPPPTPSSKNQKRDPGLVSPESTGSVNGAQSEVHSSCSPMDISHIHDGYSTEGETMYSAETAESRNYPSPPKEGKFQPMGRSQSCVSYNRWGTVQRSPVARRAMLEQQRSFVHGRKVSSQGTGSQRSNDYFSPTVSSIMKKRNNQDQTVKPKASAVHSSPRWMF